MSLLNSSAECLEISYSKRITKSTPKNLVPEVKPVSPSCSEYQRCKFSNPKHGAVFSALNFLLSPPDLLSLSLEGALAEINGLLAPCTNVLPVKLIGKNFFFLLTIRALADKRFQVLEILHARAMHGGRHGFSPFLWACFSEGFCFLSQHQFCVKAFPLPLSLPLEGEGSPPEPGKGEGGTRSAVGGRPSAQFLSQLLAIVLGHLNAASQ